MFMHEKPCLIPIIENAMTYIALNKRVLFLEDIGKISSFLVKQHREIFFLVIHKNVLLVVVRGEALLISTQDMCFSKENKEKHF